MKEKKEYNKKLIIFIILGVIILLFGIALYSFLNNPKRVVRNLIVENLELTTNLDEETLNTIIEETKSPKDNADYINLVKEILLNLQYEILKVEKTDENIVVNLKLKTKKIEPLLEEFFEYLVTETNDSLVNSESIKKDEIYNSAIKSMLENYKKIENYEEKEVVLFVNKNKDNQWKILNRNEYYNAMLGGFFTEINDYTEKKLPKVLLNSYLKELKNITAEKIAKILDSEKVTNAHEVTARYYNNMDFKILSSEKENDITIFKVETSLINIEKIYSNYNEKYINFLKEKLKERKTPLQEELVILAHNMLMESFDELEKDESEKIIKILEVKIDNSLNIVNQNNFFENLLSDLTSTIENSTKERQEKLKNLFE